MVRFGCHGAPNTGSVKTQQHIMLAKATSAGNSTSPRKYSVTHSNNTDTTSAVAPELNADQVAIVTPTKRPLKHKYNIHKKPKCFSPVKENCKTCNVQIPRVLIRHHLMQPWFMKYKQSP
jgi:hypothetical protein